MEIPEKNQKKNPKNPEIDFQPRPLRPAPVSLGVKLSSQVSFGDPRHQRGPLEPTFFFSVLQMGPRS